MITSQKKESLCKIIYDIVKEKTFDLDHICDAKVKELSSGLLKQFRPTASCERIPLFHQH